MHGINDLTIILGI